MDWVRTQENRDKSDRWFRGDVLPSIDEHGRAVLIGNWLHTDGLMARLKNTGIFTVLEFPLLREADETDIERCTWKAKYLTQEALDLKRQELGDIGFRREMLLQVVPEEGQDVLPETSHIVTIRRSTTVTIWRTASTSRSVPRKAPTTRQSSAGK